MSHPIGYPLRERIEVEFLEADVETGFTLVDMADEQAELGNSAMAARTLKSVDAVLNDIEQRMERLSRGQRSPFESLVEELRHQIERAKLHDMPTNPAGDSFPP